MPNWEDYYDILGVSSSADDKEIKKAYSDKCYIFHPDRMQGAPESAQRKAQEEMKRVNRAYGVLKDPIKRRDYDRVWRQHQHPPRAGSGPEPPPPPSPPPANIVLTHFSISPQQIQLGSSVTISLIATNNGGTPGSKTIAMVGDFIRSQSTTLNPGASATVTFTITPDRIGLFNITIGRFTGSFVVTAPPDRSPQPVPPSTKPSRRIPVLAKWLGGLLVIAIAIGLSIHFRPTNEATIIPTIAPTPVSYAVGMHPYGICCDGANIWVTNEGSNNVMKLKASDGSLVGTYHVGPGPDPVCFDGAYIWVANYGSNNVMKLRASDGTLVGTYHVGTSPNGICFDGAYIWTANNNSNDVTKLRASDGSLVGTYPVGHRPVGVCFDGANIWVTNWSSNNVMKLRASDGSLVATYALGARPAFICFDGTNIWVVNSGSNNVMKLRASDGSLVATYAVGTGPNGICFDGANIWVTNRSSNNVTELKASDGSLVGTYAVGTNPDTICFDGVNIWVTNYGDNAVTKL